MGSTGEMHGFFTAPARCEKCGTMLRHAGIAQLVPEDSIDWSSGYVEEVSASLNEEDAEFPMVATVALLCSASQGEGPIPVRDDAGRHKTSCLWLCLICNLQHLQESARSATA